MASEFGVSIKSLSKDTLEIVDKRINFCKKLYCKEYIEEEDSKL